MLEHNEKTTFKITCNINKIYKHINNAINTDLKNMLARLFEVFCFLSLHKFNSVYVIFHYLVPQLFK